MTFMSEIYGWQRYIPELNVTMYQRHNFKDGKYASSQIHNVIFFVFGPFT